MKSSYSANGLPSFMAELQIRHGKEDGIENLWKDIIAIQNAEERKAKIDELVKRMGNNKDENGFFANDDEVKINQIGNGIKIDDMGIYYSFFDILAKNHNANAGQEKPKTDGFIVLNSVKETVSNYYGGSDGNRSLNNQLTSMQVSDNDEFTIPSISVLKGKNCSMCVDRASVSHNLWLLVGKNSFYCDSKEAQFANSSAEFKNDGHAFNIVEISEGNYNMCDLAMENYGRLNGNPIQEMLSGEPLVVKGQNFKRAGVYANLTNLINKEKNNSN